MGFVLSPEAAEDLIAIRDYIARRGSPISADRWVIRLRDVCRELGKSPGIGRLRPEFADGLRSFPVGAYMIFYREQPEGDIEVVHISQGMRRFEDYFREMSRTAGPQP